MSKAVNAMKNKHLIGKRQIISALTVILVSLLFSVGAYAAQASLSCGGVQDGQVTVSVMLSSDSRIAAGSLDLVYDNTVLSVSAASAGTLAAGANPVVNPAFAADTVRFVWCGTSGITQSGALLNVTFDILDGSAEKTVFRVPVFKAETADGIRLAPTVEDLVCPLGSYTYTVTVSAPETAVSGETIDVSVLLPAGTGEAAGKLSLFYDNAALRLLSVSPGEAVEGFNPIVNPQYGENTVCLVWSAANKVQTDAGTLLNASFEVVLLPEGTAVFSVEGRMTDAKGQNVPAVFTGISVRLNSVRTLTLDPNGGSGNPTVQSVPTGTEITLPSLVRSYYVFLGWSASKTATAPTFLAGETYTVSSDAVLYAVWRKPAIAMSTTKSFGTDISTTVMLDNSIPDGSLIVIAYYDADGRVVLTVFRYASGGKVNYSFEGNRALASRIIRADAFAFASAETLKPLSDHAEYRGFLSVF